MPRRHREIGQGLLVVLNDILDLSKIEAGQIELRSTVFDLIDVIAQSADLWRNAAGEEACDWIWKAWTAVKHLCVLGETPARLRQILPNLLSNA